MEKNCLNCKYYAQPSFEMSEFCWECLRREELYTRWERKSITNADRIRSMTDQDLANLFNDFRHEHWCPPNAGDCVEYCADCWLNWLQERVEEIDRSYNN